MDNRIKLVKELSEINCIAGFEEDLFNYIKEACREFANVKLDNIGNIFIESKKLNKKNGVLLEAHGDEVGFIVKSITNNGMLRFINIGGIRKNTYCGSNVIIKNTEGKCIRGTIVSIHSSGKIKIDQKMSNAEFVIDIGANSYYDATNHFHIDIGLSVVPETRFSYDEENKICWGKAFDNRLGCAALLLTCLTLEKMQLPYQALISAQEEVGMRGIRYAMKSIEAKAAICFEGMLSKDSYIDYEIGQTALKHGPIIRYTDRSMISNQVILKQVFDIARQKNIPIQRVVKNSGETNASTIYYDFGIPTVVMGIPVRHIHTFTSIASSLDLEYSVRLATEFVKLITEK